MLENHCKLLEGNTDAFVCVPNMRVPAPLDSSAGVTPGTWGCGSLWRSPGQGIPLSDPVM